MKRMLLLSIFGFLSLSFLCACDQKQIYDLPSETQSFSQSVKTQSKTDFIWIVDNSYSMASVQQHLADEAGPFMDTLIEKYPDFHMSFVTTDMGKEGTGGRFFGTPAVLTKETPNVKDEFKKRILQGEEGSNNERGLMSLRQALGDEVAGATHSFLRDDALLVVVILSNEDDYTVITGVPSVDPKANAKVFIDFLDQIKKPFKDGSRSWVAHFMGITSLISNCKTNTENGYTDPGLRYMELVNVSGGVNSSICTTSFSVALSNIQVRVVQILTDFKLDRKPVLGTIQVFVNGTPVAEDLNNGWTYIESENVVRFVGDKIPNKATDQVRIDFKPAEVK